MMAKNDLANNINRNATQHGKTLVLHTMRLGETRYIF